jgi:hypothetical protein
MSAAARTSSPFDKGNNIYPDPNLEKPVNRYESRPSTAFPTLSANPSQFTLNNNNNNNTNNNSNNQLPITFRNYNQQSQQQQRPVTAASSRPSTISGLGAFHLGHTHSTTTLNTNNNNVNNNNNQSRPQTPNLPKFVQTDKQICRFSAYIESERAWDQDGPLGPSVIEPVIIRQMTILYYIADDSIEIVEQKNINAGMNQGVFLKRSKIQIPIEHSDNNNNTHYTNNNGPYNHNEITTMRPIQLTDLQPGKAVNILGHRFVLVDADLFTRDYFKRELQIILPPSIKPIHEMSTHHSISQHYGAIDSHIERTMGAQFATGLGPAEATVQFTKSHNTCSSDYLVRYFYITNVIIIITINFYFLLIYNDIK